MMVSSMTSSCNNSRLALAHASQRIGPAGNVPTTLARYSFRTESLWICSVSRRATGLLRARITTPDVTCTTTTLRGRLSWWRWWVVLLLMATRMATTDTSRWQRS